MKTYDITPVSKPRMTHRDKWLKPRRPPVKKYYDFKMQCLLEKVELPQDGAHIIFHLPMPKSWTKKKKKEMCGQKHKQTPDLDNLLKALSDAVYGNDSVISDVRITKSWAYIGYIQVSVKRKNKSGCVCIINDADEIVSICGAHKAWMEQQCSDCVMRDI